MEQLAKGVEPDFEELEHIILPTEACCDRGWRKTEW